MESLKKDAYKRNKTMDQVKQQLGNVHVLICQNNLSIPSTWEFLGKFLIFWGALLQ